MLRTAWLGPEGSESREDESGKGSLHVWFRSHRCDKVEEKWWKNVGSPWDISLLRIGWLGPVGSSSREDGRGKGSLHVWFRSLRFDVTRVRGGRRMEVLLG